MQHFVECVFNAKRVLLRWEKNKFNINRYYAVALAPIFHCRLCSFVDGGAKNIFWPQSAMYPSYATESNIPDQSCKSGRALRFGFRNFEKRFGPIIRVPNFFHF